MKRYLSLALLLLCASPALAGQYVGDFPTSATVRCFYNTNDQTGASITRSTDGTLKIFKNGSTTERTSLAGVTQTEDFDAATGVHLIAIDTSDNTDAGFYAAAGEYDVVNTGMVIDTKTVNAHLCSFSIQRAGVATALLIARTPNAAAGAAGGLFIAGSNAATTFATLTVTGATTLTGNMVLSDGLTISAPTTGNRAGVTIAGNGTGAGIDVTSGNGATGNAVKLVAASTNGDALSAAGVGSGVGVRMTGGATASGLAVAGGASGAHGVLITTTTTGSGIRIASAGHGLDIAPTTDGHGVSIGATGTSRHGIAVTAGTNGHALSLTGNGSGHGALIAAGATGKGISVTTTAGDALSLTPTAGHAIVATANGTSKHGMFITGGTAGTSHGATFVAGSGGSSILADLNGSVASCTGCSTAGGTTIMPEAAYVKAATSVIHEIFIKDTSTNLGKTGLTNGSSGLTIAFGRSDQGNAAFSTCAVQAATRGTYTSCGFVEKDATNAPGVYEFGLTTAMLAAGADYVTVSVYGVSGTAPTVLPIALVDIGLTALNTKLGTPAGASISADIAAVNVLGTAIKAKTDSLSFTGSDLGVIVNNYASTKAPLQPTTAGRTLNVTAAGNGGIDWANVENPTTTVGLTNTTHSTTQAIASVSGAVGSVTGAVGSVTGAVGSVTGAVGSVTGNVGGNVVGSVASVTGNLGGNVTGSVGSVTGAVGSVTGNLGGNVVGSVGSVTGAVGSVTGAVGSVTGAVGSVTGNVGGNVTGTLGSLAAQAKTDVAVAVGGRIGETAGSYTYDQMMRIMFSVLAGRTNTNGTVFKTPDNSTGRATFTIDGSNNRTGASLTP